MQRLRTFIHERAILDVRSLSAGRILLSITLLYDTLERFADRTLFYDPSVTSSVSWASIHTLSFLPSWGIEVLFLLHFAAILSLLVGWHTHRATFIALLLTISLHNTNVYVVQGGDTLLKGLLYIGLFVPWGAYWSYDARSQGQIATTYTVPWAFILFLYITLFYVGAVAYKTTPMWLSGEAVYYALSFDMIATPLAEWLRQYGTITTILTYGIVVFQLLATVALWSVRPLLRATAVTLLAIMHVCIALFLHVGYFPAVCIAMLVMVLPSSVWKRAAPHAITSCSRTQRYAAYAALFILVWSWVIHLPFSYSYASAAAQTSNSILRPFGVAYQWDMFAKPSSRDGWYIFEGVLLGEAVSFDIHTGMEVTYKRPERIDRTYKNERWRKYLAHLNPPETPQAEWDAFVHRVCAQWNTIHPAQKLEALTVTFMHIPTPPHGYT